MAYLKRLTKKYIKKGVILKNTIRLKTSVKNRDFTILCNNCWAGHIYQQLNLPYNTPTVGLYFFADCYIKFLKNLDLYLNAELHFINSSKYYSREPHKFDREYPIGQINDIEIQFLHYKNEAEAVTKWNERKKRINKENLFVVFSERDLCDKRHLEEFNALQFENKACFTAKEYAHLSSTIWIEEYKSQGYIGDIYTENDLIYKYFDIAHWLNRGK